MNQTLLDPRPWSRAHFWSAFAAVMIAQVSLLIALSDRKPIIARPLDVSTTFYLVADAPPNSPVAELASVTDPALFALPDWRGFSGEAWLKTPEMRYRAEDWAEPPQWLNLSGTELGATFLEFVRTNPIARRAVAEKPAPRPGEVAVAPIPLPAGSQVRIEGELATRELLTPLQVPSLPHTDILADTVVQAGVAPSGFAFSAVVLTSSGSKIADQRALELARTARFKPIPLRGTGAARNPAVLTWGRLVFQWHTLEMPATNNPPVQPAA